MKAGSWKRRVFRGLICLLILCALWFGIILLRHPPGKEAPAGKRPFPNEIVGVYHVHTTLSDGRKPLDEIVPIASRQRLHFLILTDHGKPNRASLASQGWKDGVLVLAGSELAVSRGHLVALDFRPPERDFAQNAEEAALEVAAAGGFTIIAHPFRRTGWSWGGWAGYSGIEIVSADSAVKENILSVIPYLPALIFNPRIFLLKTLKRPAQSLKKWDELGMKRAVSGYFSADAHLVYEALFSCLRLHVLLEKPLAQDFEKAKGQVFTSLRRGSFYCAVDSAGPAGGLAFWAETQGSRFPMGSTISRDASHRVQFRSEASFPFKVQTRLLRNGEVICSAQGPEISFPTEKPGVYRLEIYLQG